MKLIKSKECNINYVAKIVNIKEFKPHSNPGVTRLKSCLVDGFNIITGIDSEAGLYIYFPALSCINEKFLSYANLYRHKNLNADPEKSGMFEDNGRVKAIKLKGEVSEGFILPISIFKDYIYSLTNCNLENVEENTEFDAFEHDGKEYWFCKKYVPPTQIQKSTPVAKQKKTKIRVDRIRRDQFQFHYNTVLLRKYPFILNPEQIIHISSKWHGTSAISAYILCHRKLSWKQKIAKWLTGESFDNYDRIYSSRTRIKNQYDTVSEGYYKCDVWKYADEIVQPHLQKGMTIYYEIVGYTPSGSYIQKQYDYGCIPPINGEYIYDKNFKIRVYRITLTNVNGYIHEFSTQEVRQYCEKVGLIPVTEFYYGKAKDLYPELPITEHWSEDFINYMANDPNFYMELDSPECTNNVPHEGIVLKIENGRSAAYKLKCFRFTNIEQVAIDKGEINIEDES